MIVVDDDSTDGSSSFLSTGYERVQLLRPQERIGAARARNLGATHATGEVLVFSDAHVEVPANWYDPLLPVLARPDTGAVGPGISVLEPVPVRATGYGQTWQNASLDVDWLRRKSSDPYPVPLLGGGFIALPAKAFHAAKGFDSGIERWGSEDSELCVRLWALGYQCLVVPSVIVAHKFRPMQPYPITWEEVIHNKLRMAGLHFGPRRLSQVHEFYRERPEYAAATAKLASADLKLRRAELDAIRVHDDDWFFAQFNDRWITALEPASAAV